MPIHAAAESVEAALATRGPSIAAEFLDEKTPSDVIVTLEPRQPETDPEVGNSFKAEPRANKHYLVAIGDSLTQGFQSGAIFNTDLSYPALIARELNWLQDFRRPQYRGFGGLGFNIEYLIRELEQRYGDRLDWWELGSALFFVHHLLSQIRDYWQHGAGANIPSIAGIMHNLAISGYDIRDVLSRTAATEEATMKQPAAFALVPLVENAGPLIARYVLESARDATGNPLTVVDAAQALGRDGGIETLIVFIGANNALRTVIDLKVKWSDAGFDQLGAKDAYNIWRPTHFAAELDQLAESIDAVDAQHVIWATVPHVTIAPVAKGMGNKIRPGSRYFPYYSRPWIDTSQFDRTADPCITGNEARAIDSAIDQYNDAIVAVVKWGRAQHKDWRLLDVAGLLDRIAARRYLLDPSARPAWWTPYKLPPAVSALLPVPDSQFFASSPAGRTGGGLFSLDGVHATTTTYALLAQEFINVMVGAGVKFGQATAGAPVLIDFNRIIARDTLLSDPPTSLSSDLRSIGWADEVLDWASSLGRLLFHPTPAGVA